MKSPQFVALVLFAGLAACAPPPAPPSAVATTSGSAAAQPADGATGRGRVVETMNGAGYTYVRVQPASGAEFWAATTEFPVKAGDEVVVDLAMPMNNYTSRSLGRTFDLIYFAESIQVAGAASAPPPAGAPAGAPGSGSLLRQVSAPTAARPPLPEGHGSVAPPAEIDLSGIERAPGGLTVAEILAQAESLAGKQVAVRAKVVKFTSGVMGKNWLHVRDGSGDQKNADVTVTTDQDAAVGDLVVVRGLVVTNVDLGSGYSYPVLLQDAAIER